MTAAGFHHEALIHAGDQEFLDRALPFLREGLEAGEPMLVALTPGKLALLRDELGRAADELITFADMREVGGNPARIIPAWQDFVDRRRPPGGSVRGIGEPIWPGRTPAQLVECHRHEALLNLAFASTHGFQLLCPYDTDGLAPEVVAEARCHHPHVSQDGLLGGSSDWTGLPAVAAPFDHPLPEPPEGAIELAFTAGTLSLLRHELVAMAVGAGLPERRVDDLVLATNEIATNSIMHGGGEGELRLWTDPGALICEVRDAGRIDDPLAGRRRPAPACMGGYGLWVANQLCDLVQVRTTADGSAVRLHVALS